MPPSTSTKKATKKTKRRKTSTAPHVIVAHTYNQAIAAIIKLRRLPKTFPLKLQLLERIEAAAAGKRPIEALMLELPMNMHASTRPPTP